MLTPSGHCFRWWQGGRLRRSAEKLRRPPVIRERLEEGERRSKIAGGTTSRNLGNTEKGLLHGLPKPPTETTFHKLHRKIDPARLQLTGYSHDVDIVNGATVHIGASPRPLRLTPRPPKHCHVDRRFLLDKLYIHAHGRSRHSRLKPAAQNPHLAKQQEVSLAREGFALSASTVPRSTRLAHAGIIAPSPRAALQLPLRVNALRRNLCPCARLCARRTPGAHSPPRSRTAHAGREKSSP